MEFSKNEEQEIYKKMTENEKEEFNKLILSATLGALRGIDLILYEETTNEMKYFINDFTNILLENKFSNEDLKILKNLLIQCRNIIKDIKKGEN